MAASALMLSLLSVLAIFSGAGGAKSALDDVCSSLGSYYVPPSYCTSALCADPSSPCRAARDHRAVGVLAARLALANATATRDSVAAALARYNGSAPTAAKSGLRSCVELHTGFVAALEWAAGPVAAGRYLGAAHLLQAAENVYFACQGMAGAAAVPKEIEGFYWMSHIGWAVLDYLAFLAKLGH